MSLTQSEILLVMGAHFGLGVVILAVLAAALADPDIKVMCEKDSIRVIWRVGPQFVPYAARFFLGSCMPSKWTVLPTGEGEARFNYRFSDCRFTKQIKGKHLMYQTELSFRPQARPKPALFRHPVKCVYKRADNWIPKFLTPGSGVSSGQSKLVFHMALLNEQLTGVAKTNVIPLGSFMPIWAAVEQKAHQPLLMLMDECVAASTPELQPGTQVYPIIANNGCLLESKRGSSVFLPRYHSSAIILYLQAFKFGLGEQVYIHCNLIVWDSDVLNRQKKACHVKEQGSWELLDDPSRSSLCDCCDSVCTPRTKRASEQESHSRSFNSVLGPIIIVDQPGSKIKNTL
ncbi:zona pellucida glycoprotein 3f, tandem duplicate 2 [Kryptolebias marmoratus]|uniref:Zona pellucida glycoprotein 3f, tandem duplicate 2 n=1 Tax=Kryptolebias marmoratus TaxID=37003 RepID=A0A3Q3BDH1_KRYMA|nr:zona pellucida glycoprotein 3f, tandem duplicate 2 [Kryptolebias marmoratus]XP_024862682.1 zona pellucida glycoprotein 3f, tandem duplicate 2 [Kryptolebias marmoratus]